VAFKQKDWEKRREDMKSVCANCHAADWINSFYVQFDGVVDLGNEKFFKPVKDVMAKLQQAGKITNTPFDAPLNGPTTNCGTIRDAALAWARP